jgi:hypothetical protein
MPKPAGDDTCSWGVANDVDGEDDGENDESIVGSIVPTGRRMSTYLHHFLVNFH